jgi:hypothetical protein
LSELQIEVYVSERLKQIQAILVETLKTLPKEQQKAFLVEYSKK